MTIGEKIMHLRASVNISQDQLSKKLGVSRQSVSKWERDQVVPKMDILIKLCEIFNLSTDELMKNSIVINRIPRPSHNSQSNIVEKPKYFGTDGFRGEAGVELTSEHAFKVGRFLGWYFQSHLSGCRKLQHKPRVVIGKDTRLSSYTLEWALAAGLTASGADTYILHVTTTPSVSYITKQDGFDCGIMITASHNPYYDNGIKIINNKGEKIDDVTLLLVEAYLDGNFKKLGIEGQDLPKAKKDKIGCIVDYVAGRNRYVGYLISIASHSYRSLKIGLDCANGSSWMIAKAVFDALGAETYITGNTPDGTNINDSVGSTNIENLQKLVIENGLDVGYAFDGDADRCIAVDSKGNVANGDKIIYILAKRMMSNGILTKNTIVTTVMSNSGLDKALSQIGIKNIRTNVGDKNVYDEMQSGDLQLGGEQSGHIIIKKHSTTGDGILTAILVTEEMLDKKTTLAELASPVETFPQVLKNVKVSNQDDVMKDAQIIAKIKEINSQLSGKGRILVRKSGTEPLIRIMVEAETEVICNKYCDEIIDLIVDKNYAC